MCRGTRVDLSERVFRAIIEPLRIHSVEPLRLTTWSRRKEAIATADYNGSRCTRRTC